MTAIQKMTATKRRNRNRRYLMIQKRVDELMGMRVEGLRPAFDEVLKKVANEFGIEIRTVDKILKKNVA